LWLLDLWPFNRGSAALHDAQHAREREIHLLRPGGRLHRLARGGPGHRDPGRRQRCRAQGGRTGCALTAVPGRVPECPGRAAASGGGPVVAGGRAADPESGHRPADPGDSATARVPPPRHPGFGRRTTPGRAQLSTSRFCDRSRKTRRSRRTASSTSPSGSATSPARPRIFGRRSRRCTASTSPSGSWRSISRPTCTCRTASSGVFGATSTTR